MVHHLRSSAAVRSNAIRANSWGDNLKAKGDVEGALGAYRAAIGAGDPEIAALASVKIGMILSDIGEVDEARAAYQGAIHSGYREIASVAADGITLLREEYGHRVLQPGANAIPAAAFKRGEFYAGLGNISAAWAAYYDAINSGHPEYAPAAARNLGVLLESIGELQGARASFEFALKSNHPSAAPIAAGHLGFLLQRLGDIPGARAAFEHAIASRHAEIMPLASQRARRAHCRIWRRGYNRSAPLGTALHPI